MNRFLCTLVLSPGALDRVFLLTPGTSALFNADSVGEASLRRCQIMHLGYPALLPAMLTDDERGNREALPQGQGRRENRHFDGHGLPRPAHRRSAGELGGLIPPQSAVCGYRHPGAFEEALFCLRRADYLRWKDDLMAHLSRAYLRDFADELISMGALVTGFKLGAHGLYLRTAPARTLGGYSAWKSSSPPSPSP